MDSLINVPLHSEEAHPKGLAVRMGESDFCAVCLSHCLDANEIPIMRKKRLLQCLVSMCEDHKTSILEARAETSRSFWEAVCVMSVHHLRSNGHLVEEWSSIVSLMIGHSIYSKIVLELIEDELSNRLSWVNDYRLLYFLGKILHASSDKDRDLNVFRSLLVRIVGELVTTPIASVRSECCFLLHLAFKDLDVSELILLNDFRLLGPVLLRSVMMCSGSPSLQANALALLLSIVVHEGTQSRKDSGTCNEKCTSQFILQLVFRDGSVKYFLDCLKPSFVSSNSSVQETAVEILSRVLASQRHDIAEMLAGELLSSDMLDYLIDLQAAQSSPTSLVCKSWKCTMRVLDSVDDGAWNRVFAPLFLPVLQSIMRHCPQMDSADIVVAIEYLGLCCEKMFPIREEPLLIASRIILDLFKLTITNNDLQVACIRCLKKMLSSLPLIKEQPLLDEIGSHLICMMGVNDVEVMNSLQEIAEGFYLQVVQGKRIFSEKLWHNFHSSCETILYARSIQILEKTCTLRFVNPLFSSLCQWLEDDTSRRVQMAIECGWASRVYGALLSCSEEQVVFCLGKFLIAVLVGCNALPRTALKGVSEAISTLPAHEEDILTLLSAPLGADAAFSGDFEDIDAHSYVDMAKFHKLFYLALLGIHCRHHRWMIDSEKILLSMYTLFNGNDDSLLACPYVAMHLTSIISELDRTFGGVGYKRKLEELSGGMNQRQRLLTLKPRFLKYIANMKVWWY